MVYDILVFLDWVSVCDMRTELLIRIQKECEAKSNFERAEWFKRDFNFASSYFPRKPVAESVGQLHAVE